MPNNHEFIDADIRLRRVDDETAARTVTQAIPDQFLRDLKDQRSHSANAPMGEMHKVASIPVAVVEKWIAEGFNIFDKNVTVPEIVKRLQSEDLTAFMATERRIG